MRKQTWIVNILLIAAAVALTIKVRGDWIRANQRYSKLSAATAPKPGALPVGPMNATLNTPAGDTIVQGNLFTPDRNNTKVLRSAGHYCQSV